MTLFCASLSEMSLNCQIVVRSVHSCIVLHSHLNSVLGHRTNEAFILNNIPLKTLEVKGARFDEALLRENLGAGNIGEV